MTTKDKLEFTYAMAKHSAATLGDIQRLMRYGASIKAFAEIACNRELTHKEILREENLFAKVIQILAPIDCEPKFSGDPRGATVKIVVPDGYTNDWGKEGICVPTS